MKLFFIKKSLIYINELFLNLKIDFISGFRNDNDLASNIISKPESTLPVGSRGSGCSA